MRQISCSECGWTGRVLKEATTGAPIVSFVCLNCLTAPNDPRPDATILQFPAASERLGSAPAQACDVTRRGDSSKWLNGGADDFPDIGPSVQPLTTREL